MPSEDDTEDLKGFRPFSAALHASNLCDAFDHAVLEVRSMCLRGVARECILFGVDVVRVKFHEEVVV
jgi:hypothetical protein